MYTPAPFAETRLAVLHAFMRRHPFATVLAVASGAIEALHVPLLLDAEKGPLGCLRGHMARANPFWRVVPERAEVLVMFRGADSYISPAWYPSKREHGRVVPTWNYEVVQVRGTVRWLHDTAALRALVGDLTEEHEAGRTGAWSLNDAPHDYIAGMLKGIVGFEVLVTELNGSSKLSQNKSQADRAGVIEGLKETGGEGSSEMATLMAKWNRESGS